MEGGRECKRQETKGKWGEAKEKGGRKGGKGEYPTSIVPEPPQNTFPSSQYQHFQGRITPHLEKRRI